MAIASLAALFLPVVPSALEEQLAPTVPFPVPFPIETRPARQLACSEVVWYHLFSTTALSESPLRNAGSTMASRGATAPSCARGLVQRRPPVAVAGRRRPGPGQPGRPEHGTNGSCSGSCAGQLAVRGTSTLEAVQHIEQGIPVHRTAACPPARWPRGCTRPHTARLHAYVRRPRTFAARGAGQHCYQGQAPGPAPSPASPGSALLRWRSAELMARLAPLPRHPSCSGLGDL